MARKPPRGWWTGGLPPDKRKLPVLSPTEKGEWYTVPLSRGGKLATRVLVLSADDLAWRLLRACHGSASAAHAAVTRAVRRAKRPKGRPPEPDAGLLLLAAAIKQKTGCTKRAALLQAAEDDDKTFRRLSDKVGHRSLATIAKEIEDALRHG
jgi:hypothetical protein